MPGGSLLPALALAAAFAAAPVVPAAAADAAPAVRAARRHVNAGPAFHLRSGDRVVFFGDSITDQRLYTVFVETFVLTRFPEMAVEFVHAGWGGDRVSGGGGGSSDLRLRRDVIAHAPTVVTIMLGMNDGRYRPFDQEAYDAFAVGYERIVRLLRTSLPQARLTLMEPSPYDEVTRPSPMKERGGLYNDVLLRFGAFVKALAARERVGVADLNSDLVQTLARAAALDPALAPTIIPDRVHPAAAGHLVLAGSLLKAWGASSLVSSVDLDGARGRLVRAHNTTVSALKLEGARGAGTTAAAASTTLRWTQIDRALPFPIDTADPATELVLRASRFVESFNQQPLKVSGLGEGPYALRVDDEQVGIFRGPELARGINLAVLPTPMTRQAAEVHAFTARHNHVRFTRWRQLQLVVDERSEPDAAAALAALDKLERALVAKQRLAAQPRARRFELRAVPEAAASVPTGFTPIFGSGTLGRVLLDGRKHKAVELFLELDGACDGVAALLLRARDSGEAYRVSLDCREGGSFGRIDAVGYEGVKPTHH